MGDDKLLLWVGSSREAVRGFPDAARRKAGFELRRAQKGMLPTDWKAMSHVGSGVYEIRIHAEGEFRVLYVAKFAEAVYVLHAFEKHTRRTPQLHLDLAIKRLGELKRSRAH